MSIAILVVLVLLIAAMGAAAIVGLRRYGTGEGTRLPGFNVFSGRWSDHDPGPQTRDSDTET